MPTLQELAQHGQSVWVDVLSRQMLQSGQLQALIDQGVCGATANPTILEKAIVGSALYDDDLRRAALRGEPITRIYQELALGDIGQAADLFRPVYDASLGQDGFVSIEVDPGLAHDTDLTIAEGRQLFAALNRPNVMIKVPATAAGYPAIARLTEQGVNVNVTLIFSQRQYREAAGAYMTGLERRLAAHHDVSGIHGVASFFVSRMDTAVDRLLADTAGDIQPGTIAIANAKLAYADFQQMLNSPRWEQLAARGANVQRPLWASTSTKNPAFPDTLYVDNLIGPDTVSTMPLTTLHAWLDHGKVADTVTSDVEQARDLLARLARLGINIDEVARDLEEEGIANFAHSFHSLMSYIASRESQFAAEARRQNAA